MSDTLSIAMLLDNHYAPDPRVGQECGLFLREDVTCRVIAWDRRPQKNVAVGSVTRLEVEGVDVIRVGAPAPAGGGKQTLRGLVRFCRTIWPRRRIFLSDVDLLIVHDVYLLPLAWLLARSLKLPYAYDAHEDYAAMEGSRLPRWWVRLVTTLETLIAARAAVVVVPGRTRVDRWTSVGIQTPLVLPNHGRLTVSAASDADDETWDLAYVCGTLSPSRRPDVFLAAARLRPDLRFLLAGDGRSAATVAEAANALPNVDFIGWVDDVDAVMRCSKAIFYGLDPAHPYSSKACPNTLYQALRARRPIIFFCGGEPAELLRRFQIGIRCAPDPEAVVAALGNAVQRSDWDYEEALAAIDRESSTQNYVDVLMLAARVGRTGRLSRTSSAVAIREDA